MARRHWLEDVVDGVVGTLEHAATLGTSAVTAPVGEVANMLGLALGKDASGAAQWRDAVNSLAYTPRTQLAQYQQQQLAGALEPAARWVDENVAEPLRQEFGAETVSGAGSLLSVVPIPGRAQTRAMLGQAVKAEKAARKASDAELRAGAKTPKQLEKVEEKISKQVPITPMGTDRRRYESLLITPDQPTPAGKPSYVLDAEGNRIEDPVWAQPHGVGKSKGVTAPTKLEVLDPLSTEHGTPVPVLNDKGVQQTSFRKTSPMLLNAKDAVTSDYYGRPTVANPRRIMYPDIYADERIIVDNAAQYVAPESPALRHLFNVDRQDLDTMMSERILRTPMTQQAIQHSRSGVPEYLQQIMTPRNEQRLQDVLGLAGSDPRLTGGYGWYELEPLRNMFIQEWGPEEGMRRFDLMNQWSAALSAQSSPVPELNRFSLSQQLLQQGRPDLFFNAKADDFKIPGYEGFGAMGHNTHVAGMRRLGDTGFFAKLGPTEAAKTRNYYSTMGGDPWWSVMDAHFMRAIGAPDVRDWPHGSPLGMNVEGNEARALMEWYQRRVAGPLGYGASPGQALQWGVFGPATGLQGYANGTVIGKPRLELIADAVAQQAAATGKSQRDVLQAFVRGEGLLGPRDAPPPKLRVPPTPTVRAYGTHEQIPGQSTGHLPGLNQAPLGTRQAHTLQGNWTNPLGQDIVELGNQPSTIGVSPSQSGTGAFTSATTGMLETQPSTAAVVNVPAPGGVLDPGTMARIHAAETVRGAVDVQDAAAYHVPVPSDTPDALRIARRGALNDDQMTKLQAELKARGLPLSPSDTGDGVTFFDTTYWGGQANTPQQTLALQKPLDAALKKAGIDHNGMQGVEANGNLISLEDEWRRGSGAVTGRIIAEEKYLTKLATDKAFMAEVEKKLQDMRDNAGTHGGTRADVENLLEIISQSKGNWLDDVKAALANGTVLPAVAATALGLEVYRNLVEDEESAALLGT